MSTISIDHLTRVEGNGGISATIDGKVVTDVKFNIYEGPRLIERLTVGRTPEEDVSMAPRICAICSVSHKNAVLRAMENALDVKVSEKVYYSRELMHMGEMVESHALHTFLLALPDYLGFPNAIAMAADYELEAQIGLEMKNFGNHIMKTYSGRFIHGENPVIGGFGKFPGKKDLAWIKARAIQFMPFVHKTISLFCELPYPDNPEEDTLYACCEPGNNQYGFWGDEIVLSSGDKFFRDDYPSFTNEFLVPHSYAKRSRYNGKPFSVGALARVNILGERLAGESATAYKKYFNEHWKRNPLYHVAAQALELLFCFERIPTLVDILLQLEEDPPLIEYTALEGNGTGMVEAPRGLLIHHYEVTGGLVEHADIITPTAMNAEDIERYCQIAAQKLLDEGREDEIKDRLDIVVRAFDPCISCSAHTVEVEHTPKEAWKDRLAEIKKTAAPIFIGVGNEERSDDRVGLALAQKMKKQGIQSVILETEIEETDSLWNDNPERPLIFLDAVNWDDTPGKITMISLDRVLNNATLSHKFLPFLSGRINSLQLRNSFVLGIQPRSTELGTNISFEVKEAMDLILSQVKD